MSPVLEGTRTSSGSALEETDEPKRQPIEVHRYLLQLDDAGPSIFAELRRLHSEMRALILHLKKRRTPKARALATQAEWALLLIDRLSHDWYASEVDYDFTGEGADLLRSAFHLVYRRAAKQNVPVLLTTACSTI